MITDVTDNGSNAMTQGQFEWYTTTEHGIEFKRGTPQPVWLGVVHGLTAMFESSHRLHVRTMFLLGDALTFGEAAYGEEYAQAIDLTRKVMQLSEKTIKNAAWICASVAPARRRETLTLAHHEVVAPYPDEQEELLSQAESENLTVSALKKIVKERHPKTKRGTQRKGTSDLKSEEGLRTAQSKINDWLAENEKTLTDKQLKAWKPLLAPVFKLYRRHWQSGHVKR
jgi:hypothetical protein